MRGAKFAGLALTGRVRYAMRGRDYRERSMLGQWLVALILSTR